jgi:hypothetical protein
MSTDYLPSQPNPLANPEDLDRQLRDVQEAKARLERHILESLGGTVQRTASLLTRHERIEQLRAKERKALSPARMNRLEALVERLLHIMDVLIQLKR